MTVKKWESVDLTCHTNAESVQWQKDGRSLGSMRRVTIARAEREDAGSYKCELSAHKP